VSNDLSKIRSFLIEKIIVKADRHNIKVEEPGDEFSLTASGLFDSMDFLNLMLDIENAFGVTVDFSDAEPEEFTTLGGFLRCIKHPHERVAG
jgi:acyl carrier protein